MNALVLMSGGIDSTACVHYLLSRGESVRGVFVDYGQPAANPEREAVEEITRYYGIPFTCLSFQGGHPWGTGEILGRNAFLIFAALMGAKPQTGVICLGVHAGSPYYDCSTDFISRAQSIIDAYSGGQISLYCPFLSKDKMFIKDYSVHVNVPLHLTYSCEAGNEPPCLDFAHFLGKE